MTTETRSRRQHDRENRDQEGEDHLADPLQRASGLDNKRMYGITDSDGKMMDRKVDVLRSGGLFSSKQTQRDRSMALHGASGPNLWTEMAQDVHESVNHLDGSSAELRSYLEKAQLGTEAAEGKLEAAKAAGSDKAQDNHSGNRIDYAWMDVEEARTRHRDLLEWSALSEDWAEHAVGLQKRIVGKKDAAENGNSLEDPKAGSEFKELQTLLDRRVDANRMKARAKTTKTFFVNKIKFKWDKSWLTKTWEKFKSWVGKKSAQALVSFVTGGAVTLEKDENGNYKVDFKSFIREFQRARAMGRETATKVGAGATYGWLLTIKAFLPRLTSVLGAVAIWSSALGLAPVAVGASLALLGVKLIKPFLSAAISVWSFVKARESKYRDARANREANKQTYKHGMDVIGDTAGAITGVQKFGKGPKDLGSKLAKRGQKSGTKLGTELVTGNAGDKRKEAAATENVGREELAAFRAKEQKAAKAKAKMNQRGVSAELKLAALFQKGATARPKVKDPAVQAQQQDLGELAQASAGALSAASVE